MKKSLILSLCLLAVFGITACNNKTTTPESSYAIDIDEGQGGSQFAGKLFKSGELKKGPGWYLAVKFTSDTQIQVDQAALGNEPTFSNAENVTISGSGELSVTLENEKNAYEVLKPVEEWCNSNSFLIDGITIDDRELHPYIDEEYENISVESIKRVEIEALSRSEYYLQSIMSIMEYIEKVAITDSATLTERDAEALKDGLIWIMDSVPRAVFLCNMNLETYGMVHILKMLEVKLERLNSFSDGDNDYLEKIKEFFQNDLKPFVNEDFIPAMNLVLEDAKINTIIIFSNDINRANALYKIGTLPKFKPYIIEILDRVVDKLQTGNDKEAFIYAEKFSRIVAFAFNILSKVAEIFSINYENIKIDGVSLLDSINDFNDMMNDVLDAFSNEDYISIADLLEYEIKEKIENITNYTPLLEEYIERGIY